MLEVAPLSYQQKKQTARFLNRMPDWLMVNWAEALNIDYIGGCTMYPDMVEQANSEIGRQLAQHYIESHDAVPAANVLGDLVKTVVKQANESKLPSDGETIERQVCALALSGCDAEGAEFAENTIDILSDAVSPNHPLIDYQIALERGDKDILEKLDTILTGGRYGEWVTCRLDEAKRYLGLDYPIFRINFIERTPQWDALWENIIKGGSND
jgi:hypothetical protein